MNIPIVTENGTLSNNYYKVPVNYQLSSDGDIKDPTYEQEVDRAALYKLQQNYLYDVTLLVDKAGSTTPKTAVALSTNYTIADWTTRDVVVNVEGFNFIYVKNTDITLPNSTSYTTTFQSSTPDVTISDITVNGVQTDNNTTDISISATSGTKAGNIVINSPLPTNFVAKEITFIVRNGAGSTQKVTVTQYPALYIGSHTSMETPGGSQGQDNKKMYIISSFVADFSTLPDPDEFDENFTHLDPEPDLGASYASYIRSSAVLGYPTTDTQGATIDSDENNRRMSPQFMLASQYGVTVASDYATAREHCIDYVERDSTTGQSYSDWRIPTLAETYMIDVLQNIRIAEVKRILEGSYYWSARGSQSVKFMDPRVGGTNSNYTNASVRCVRDVKN